MGRVEVGEKTCTVGEARVGVPWATVMDVEMGELREVELI
jgi:hypothetical protein